MLLKRKKNILGHGYGLHPDTISLSVPTQKSPSFLGGGSLHCLVLFWFPKPHVLSHSPYSDHCPQLPWTR